MTTPEFTTLDVKVVNHPGVLTRIISLFSRRAFNVDGVICLPIPNTDYSRLWLKLPVDNRLPQVIRQLEKQEDVVEVAIPGTQTDYCP